jgi:hypothetical protein
MRLLGVLLLWQHACPCYSLLLLTLVLSLQSDYSGALLDAMRRASQAPMLPTVSSSTHQQQQQQQQMFNSSASSGGSHSTTSGPLQSPTVAAYTLTPSLLETTPPHLSLPSTAAAAQLNSSGGSSAGSTGTAAAAATSTTAALPRAVLPMPTHRGPARGAQQQQPPGAGRGLDTEDGDPGGGGASAGEFEVKDNLLVRDAFVCTMAELLGGIGGFVRRSEVCVLSELVMRESAAASCACVYCTLLLRDAVLLAVVQCHSRFDLAAQRCVNIRN